jgi:hypothetical protein
MNRKRVESPYVRSGLTPVEFNTKYNMYKKYLSDMKLLDIHKGYFLILMTLYNFPEKKLKVLEKMKPDQKFGYMSEFLIKCSRKINIPNYYIQNYLDTKESYNFCKKHKWVKHLQEKKDRLFLITIDLLKCCNEEYSKKKLRNTRIDEIGRLNISGEL